MNLFALNILDSRFWYTVDLFEIFDNGGRLEEFYSCVWIFQERDLKEFATRFLEQSLTIDGTPGAGNLSVRQS